MNIRDLISEAVLYCTVRRGAWPSLSVDARVPRERAAQPLLLLFSWRWWKESGAGVIWFTESIWRGSRILVGMRIAARDGHSAGPKELVGVNNLASSV